MLHFENTSYLYLFVAIVFLVIVFLAYQIWKRKKQRLFSSSKMFEVISPNRSLFKSPIHFLLMCLALSLIIIALVNPQYGTKTENVKREGIDIVFTIDVSKSMLSQDVKPNRIKKAQHIVNEIIKNLQGDRVGIVAYAAQAFPQLGLTTDYSAVKMFIDALNTDMISSQGTAIEQALSTAASYFDTNQNTSKIIILLTDGEDHLSGASEIAKEISEKSIRIYTVGIGSENGAPIPLQGEKISYKKDKQGNTVISRLNPTLLQEIAQEGNGTYFSGQNTKDVVSKLLETIQNMTKTEFEIQKVVDYDDKFQYFLALAIAVLFIDGLISYKKTSWFKKRKNI